MLCKLECEGMKQPGWVGGCVCRGGGGVGEGLLVGGDDGYHVCHKESSSPEVI